MGDGVGDDLDQCFDDSLTAWLLVCGVVYGCVVVAW